MDPRRRRGHHAADHLGEHRVRVPRRRPPRHPEDRHSRAPARGRDRVASVAAGSDGVRAAGHGRHARRAAGLRLLPDRRRPRVLPRGRRGAPARQAPRHPLHDGRAAGGDRRSDRAGGAGIGGAADSHDARLGQVRRPLPEDGHPGRLGGVRGPRLRGGRDARLPAEAGRPHHGSGAGGGAGRPDGVRGQGAHHRRRRHRPVRPDHLLSRGHAGSRAHRPRGPDRARRRGDPGPPAAGLASRRWRACGRTTS